MPIDQDRDRKRGLPAVHTMRAARKSGRFGRTTVKLVAYAGVAVAMVMVGYNYFTDRKLAQSREQLAMQARAVRATVGARWTPLQGELEAVSLGVNGASAYPGDLTDPMLHTWDFRTEPGLYVRMRLADIDAADPARQLESFRRVMQFSTRDGFTSCVFKSAPNDDHHDTGLVDQPWNLKTAYQAVRVLGDDWLQEVESTDSELRLRAYTEQWENARDSAIPRVVDMMTRATFYLFVYDEDVAEEILGPAPDGGASNMARLQMVPHPVRIHLVDLRSKKLVLRRRLTADAGFRLVGEGALDDDAERAVRRQVQNCQLARDFWGEVQHKPAAAP